MKRFEVVVALGTLALTAVLLGVLWHILADTTLYNKSVGKAPFNQNTPNKADPW